MDNIFYSDEENMRKRTLKTLKTRMLRAFVVSDVHMNDRPYNHDEHAENQRRKHFREFLTHLVKTHDDKNEQLILVLNGDILDIMGSWFGTTRPWDEDTHQVEAVLLEVIQRILSNNQAIFQQFSHLLAFNNVQIIYVIGNHDSMLNFYPASKSLIQATVSPDEKSQNQFLFMNSFESMELGLYAEHGHRLDSFNHNDPKSPFVNNPFDPALSAKNRFTFGDYVEVLVINRFVEEITKKLSLLGYSAETITVIRQELQDIQYLRPLTLIPLWVKNTAKQFRKHPENEEKEESIESVILSVMAEILDTNTTRPLLEKLNLPRKFMTPLLHWFVHLPGTLPLVTFIISTIYSRSHSNRSQFRLAQRLHRNKGYKFITFGHTHGPAALSLSHDGYYFNTGSWLPIIYLFKNLDFDQTTLETLNPFVRFNKIEHSGILKIEKNLTEPDSEPVFSLQTTRSNLPLFED